MEDMRPADRRTMGRIGAFGFLVVAFALGFAYLLATYWLARLIVPEWLGEVARSPVRFAALISLVEVPLAALRIFVLTRRSWSAFVATGVTVDAPQLTGRRRLANSVVNAAEAAVAAVIVFTWVSDPGDVGQVRLVAISVLGPILLPRLVSGPFRLARRRWRRDRPE